MEEYKKQFSVKVMKECIHFFFQINQNCHNEHSTAHNFLSDARKLVDEEQGDTDKIQALRKFSKDNVVIFPVIEKKFQKILDIKTIYQSRSQYQTFL